MERSTQIIQPAKQTRHFHELNLDRSEWRKRSDCFCGFESSPERRNLGRGLQLDPVHYLFCRTRFIAERTVWLTSWLACIAPKRAKGPLTLKQNEEIADHVSLRFFSYDVFVSLGSDELRSAFFSTVKSHPRQQIAERSYVRASCT